MMKEYIDYHNRNQLTQFIIRLVINLSYKFNSKVFCLFWNSLFFFINNSVRIKVFEDKSFLVRDSSNELIIGFKERFEFYMQSIEHRYKLLSEEYMLDEINFYENDIIVDCGANIGEIYSLIKQINGKNYNFHYFGFEPSKFEFNILNKNSNNNVEQPLALFNKDTKKNFYLNGELADSSLIKNDKSSNIVKVYCVRLDSFIDVDKKIKLLKLEAEGSELDVLKGATKILQNIEYISADLGFEINNNTESSFIEVNQFLIKNGFELMKSHKRWVFLYKNKNSTNR